MTSTRPVGRPGDAMDEEAIAGYLDAFPDFFERHTQLLQRLRLPHGHGGAAVSLVEKQVEVLRERNRQLDRKLADFVEVARGNDALAAKMHRLVQRLVPARGIAAVVSAIESSLREDFEVTQSVLVLFRSDDALRAQESRFLRLARREDADIRSFDNLFSAGKPRCGQVRDSQRDYLFGAGAVDVASVALVPLGPGGSIGLLACASSDLHRFNPTMSTDFLARIGEMVGAAIAAE
jgi:uncharacterized protein